MNEPHSNWIGGEWRAAVRGKSYGIASPGGESVQRWPRSDGDDVELAIEAAGEGGRAWRDWPRAERLELLEDALATDLFLGDPDGALAARVGAASFEVEPWVTEARRRGSRLLRRRDRAPRAAASTDPERPPAQATTALVRVHGAALFAGLVERVWPLLLEGWAVVLLADAALPMAARELCLALDHADLPAGAMALLCDDGANTLRAGLLAELSRTGPGFVHLVDLGERRAETLELAARPRGGRRASRAGASAGPVVRFETLAGATRVVRGDDDPERAAREVALAALGRSQALSGQREGQIGRAVVHRRLFSRFSEALLAELDHLGRQEPGPLAPLDADLPRYVERMRRLGLDEGATLLRGDSGTWFGPQGGAGSHRGGRDGTLEPLVFTNVEPRMRLARAQRPAPLLRLLRADDDDAALRCADELDLAP